MNTTTDSSNDVTTVNRIPPSGAKRRHSSGRDAPRMKRQKKKSPSGASRPQPMDLEPQFSKLDPNDPAHANRIQQRRKAVAKGKNTAGYSSYIEKVPRESRRSRCMDTPSTPNPSLDIPTKRWQGMVRAWRVALHKYDPPELVNSFSSEPTDEGDTSIDRQITKAAPATPATKKARELEEAAAKGLLVDFGDDEAQILDANSPLSVMTVASPCSPDALDDYDKPHVDLEADAAEDSDDDLL